IAIQKSGLGILGNMILIKESYPLICAKIPQFLDMAFSYVLDAERNYTLRKEAVLIVNNFLITFCHDNKLNQFSLLPSSDESLAELNQLSRESVSGNEIDDLFELFEHCGFFEHLKSVISDCGTFSVVFMDALSALLLNLCIVAPKIFFVKMGGSDTWDGLLMFLESTYTLPNNPLLGVSSDNSSVLVTFRESQYKTCFSHFIESTQYNILSLALILLSENDDVLNAYVVQNLHILDHIKGLASYLSTEHMWTSQTTSRVISVSFCILAEVVKLPSLCDNVKLSSWLATDGNALNILQGCVSIIAASGGLHPELVKVSCLLLARLLSMHFGGSLDLELQNYLAFKSADSEVSVGEQLAVLLFSLTSEMIEDFDLVHVESVRIGLQILYAHFQPAKRRAISSGCLGEILDRMCGILKSCKTSRATEKQKIVLHLSLTLVRHILVNSSEEKAYAHNRGLIKILSEILCFQEANDLILGEALLCLNNSLANHHQSESWLVRHPTAGGLTVVECVVKAMKLNSHFSAVFEASVAVLRMFVLQNPVRNSLVKGGFLNDCNLFLSKAAKEKDFSKAQSILSLFHNFSVSRYGQICIVKCSGILLTLIDLVNCKSQSVQISSILVLKNLAIPNENKTHFTSDENLLPQLRVMLENRKSRNVEEAILAFLSVLAHGSEKTKAVLKSVGLLDYIGKGPVTP
ncbi:hypothetical protein HDU82_007653, partial [Entophlyctis luteolus]